MNELLDAECDVELTAPIKALSGATLVGLELGELGLPESEDVGFDSAEPGDVADAVIKPVGNLGLRSDAFLS